MRTSWRKIYSLSNGKGKCFYASDFTCSVLVSSLTSSDFFFQALIQILLGSAFGASPDAVCKFEGCDKDKRSIFMNELGMRKLD